MRRKVYQFAQRLSILALGLSIALGATSARADVLFESGTLGTTGASWTNLINQTVPGTNISQFAYNGVKFELERTALVTEIGGHFVGPTEGTFFGAIVALDSESDFPDSGNLATPDVLGHTLLTFPTSSGEVFSELSLRLDSGWYALVFGSGLFGATTDGAAVRNGTDIGSPAYIGHQPLSGSDWGILLNPIFRNHRFVVYGEVVPEPIEVALLFPPICFGILIRTQSRR